MISLLLGCGIAYVVNIPMVFYEKHFIRICKWSSIRRYRRPFCMFLSFLTLILIGAVLWQLIFPQVVSCGHVIYERFPQIMEVVYDWLEERFHIGDYLSENMEGWLNEPIQWQKLITKIPGNAALPKKYSAENGVRTFDAFAGDRVFHVSVSRKRAAGDIFPAIGGTISAKETLDVHPSCADSAQSCISEFYCRTVHGGSHSWDTVYDWYVDLSAALCDYDRLSGGGYSIDPGGGSIYRCRCWSPDDSYGFTAQNGCLSRVSCCAAADRGQFDLSESCWQQHWSAGTLGICRGDRRRSGFWGGGDTVCRTADCSFLSAFKGGGRKTKKIINYAPDT